MTSDYEISLDRVIYQQSRGLFVKVQEPINPGSSNFLIVSHYGGYDWSGFRRLDEIVPQLKDIEGQRDDGFYRVVERN